MDIVFISWFVFAVYGMVPFLNAILGTMLPMLSMARQDNMKWVFSSGIHRFTVKSNSFFLFEFDLTCDVKT